MRVAIVEDERKLASSLSEGVVAEGCEVQLFFDGETALEHLTTHHREYVIAIVDLMLPGKSGLDVCRELRAHGIALPIIVLTARDAIEDKVAALDSGADDYLTKPFSFEELLARMRAILRRSREMKPEQLTVGEVMLDTGKHEVSRKGKLITLTHTEFELLQYLMQHPDTVRSREDISAELWDLSDTSLSNVVDVHIRNLRKKIDDEYDAKIIRTVRGVGYAVQR